MNKNRLSFTGVLIGALITALIGGVALTQGWLPGALAQAKSVEPLAEASVPALPRTITVVGSGSVKIKPDLAWATIGVETNGSSVKVATSSAGETMEALIAALKAQGISEADIQTSGYSVWVDRDRGPDGRLTETSSYRVNNTVTVKVRVLDQVGAVLDAAIEAGANTIHGVRFALDEPTALESEARAKAIDHALAKARELADLNDVKVGQILSVSEVVGSGGGLYDSNFSRMEASAGYGGGGAGPVSPGELELSLRLQVVYAIQ